MKLGRCVLPLFLTACAGKELPPDPAECLSEVLDTNSTDLPKTNEDADLVCYGAPNELAEYGSEFEVCEVVNRVGGAITILVNIGDLRRPYANEHAFVGMYKCDDWEGGAIYGSALSEVYSGPVVDEDNEFLVVSSTFNTDCLPEEVITLQAYLVEKNSNCSGVSTMFSAEVYTDGSSTVDLNYSN